MRGLLLSIAIVGVSLLFAWPYHDQVSQVPALVWIGIGGLGISLGTVHLYLRFADKAAQKGQNGLIRIIGTSAADREVMRLSTQLVFMTAGLASFFHNQIAAWLILSSLFAGNGIIVAVTAVDLLTRRAVNRYQENNTE